MRILLEFGWVVLRLSLLGTSAITKMNKIVFNAFIIGVRHDDHYWKIWILISLFFPRQQDARPSIDIWKIAWLLLEMLNGERSRSVFINVSSDYLFLVNAVYAGILKFCELMFTYEFDFMYQNEYFPFLGRKPSKTELFQAWGSHSFESYGSHQRTFTFLLWDENNRSKLTSQCRRGLEIFRRFPSGKVTRKAFKFLRGTTAGLWKSRIETPKQLLIPVVGCVSSSRQKLSLAFKPKVQTVARKVKLCTSHTTRESSNRTP